MKNTFLLTVFFLSFKVPFASAETTCLRNVHEAIALSSLATASTIANTFGKDGSLKKESKRLLSAAVDAISGAQVPQDACPQSCETNEGPSAFLRSVPNKFLSSYSDQGECQTLDAQTKKEPLKYTNLKFQTLDELNNWFGDFSQGKGKEGADLYARCPGSCSPQYTNIVRKVDNYFSLEVEVICGPARDKGDNQYQLSAGYRWNCK